MILFCLFAGARRKGDKERKPFTIPIPDHAIHADGTYLDYHIILIFRSSGLQEPVQSKKKGPVVQSIHKSSQIVDGHGHCIWLSHVQQRSRQNKQNI